MKVYTKTGDKGETSLVGGKRVKKYDLRVETYGTIDELNTHISLCAKYVTSEQNKQELNHIQKKLFDVGAELATEDIKKHEKVIRITAEETLMLEEKIDAYLKELPEVKQFILPGRSKPGAHLHVARTVARRAERLLVRLAQDVTIRNEIQKYVNRLSDFLYVIAREEDFRYDLEQLAQEAIKRYEKKTEQEVSYHKAFSLDFCVQLARAVEIAAKKEQVSITMSIVNKEGYQVFMHHMPKALLVSVDVARKKAYTVVAMQASTEELSLLTQPGAPLYQLETMTDGQIMTLGGGEPIINGNGEIIGALGISGATLEQDVAIAKQALAQVVIE